MRWLSAWYARAFTFLIASLAGSNGAASQDDPDAAAWQRAREVGTFEAYQRYLEEFPIGRYANQAFRYMIEESLEEEIGAEADGLAGDFY